MGERDRGGRDGEGPGVTRVETSVHVAAPPERVWEVVSNPRNLRIWDRHIVGVEDVPEGGLREGASYAALLRFMGVRARVRAEVLAWEPPHRAVVRVTGPVVEATVTTTVEPAGDASILRHEVEYRFRGGPIGEVAARSLELVGGAYLAVRHGALAQKRHVERGGA